MACECKLSVTVYVFYRCNEAELSMDEMNSGSSAYMKEDLYKRKFVATWQELCKLFHVSDEIEVAERDGSGVYTGTPYPEINRRVQRLLKLDEFPDHFDILELVERCNSKYELGIGADEKSQLSRKLFKEVGKLLKERRQRDFNSHFGSHLTDSMKFEEDPALVDVTLLQELRDSLQQGKDKMEQVCEDFVTKQVQEQDSSKSPEGDSCNSDNDQDEEEDDGEAGEEMEGFSPDAELEDDISDHSLEDEEQLHQIPEDKEVDVTGNGNTSEKDDPDSVTVKQVEKNERDVDVDKDSCQPTAKKPKLEANLTSEETIQSSSSTSGPSSSPLVADNSGPSSSPLVVDNSGPSSSPPVADNSGPSSSPLVADNSGPSSSPLVADNSGPSSSPPVADNSGPSSSPLVADISGPSSSTDNCGPSSLPPAADNSADQTEKPPVKSTPSKAQDPTVTQSTTHEIIWLSDSSNSDNDVICIDSQ